MSKHLRAGQVVRIRVNPKDCLSVLDLLESVNYNTKNTSFAQCVSLALSSLLHTARTSNILPDPDGFEYLTRMTPFTSGTNLTQKKKMEITESIYSRGSKFQAPTLSEITNNPPMASATTGWTREQRMRIEELNAKMELAAQPGSGIIWGKLDQEEYDMLGKLI